MLIIHILDGIGTHFDVIGGQISTELNLLFQVVVNPFDMGVDMGLPLRFLSKPP